MPSLTISMNDIQKTPVKIRGLNKANKPVPLPTVPTWATDDPTIVTGTPAVDGLSADIVAVAPGTANVTITETLPDGTSFTSTIAVTVVAAPPVAFDVTIGDPVDNIPPAPGS